jgi:large subunit ribosomal protein L1
MGKTKTKIIDDSVAEEPVKKAPEPTHPASGGKKEEDSLVAKLNAELGIEEASKPEVEEAVVEAETASDEEITENAPKEKKATEPEVKEKPKKTRKPGKAKPRSKKYQEVSADLNRDQTYPLTEAIDLVKKLSYSKFNGTLEIHINTAQTGVRGLVSLPFASGKKLRILAFGPAASKADSSEVTFGDDNTISEIEKGKFDFDLVITTPDFMPKLAKVARVLGPKGLMPNPKNGTITTDLNKTIENFQAGQTEYKTEAKAPVIHLGLGKLNQPTEELSANVKMLLQTIGKSRIKRVTLAPTMGPSVKLDSSSIG